MFEEYALDVVLYLMRNGEPYTSAIGANRLHDRPAPSAPRVAARRTCMRSRTYWLSSWELCAGMPTACPRPRFSNESPSGVLNLNMPASVAPSIRVPMIAIADALRTVATGDEGIGANRLFYQIQNDDG